MRIKRIWSLKDLCVEGKKREEVADLIRLTPTGSKVGVVRIIRHLAKVHGYYKAGK